jgi:hypothetical protein
VFINTNQGDTRFFEQVAQEQAQRHGWLFERKKGNRRLLEALINGQWNDDEFLVVPPGYMIQQSTDTTLIQVVPAS